MRCRRRAGELTLQESGRKQILGFRFLLQSEWARVKISPVPWQHLGRLPLSLSPPGVWARRRGGDEAEGWSGQASRMPVPGAAEPPAGQSQQLEAPVSQFLWGGRGFETLCVQSAVEDA